MNTATILAAALLAVPFVPEVDAATSEVRPVGDFQSIEYRGAGHLVVTAGQPGAVSVSADPAQLPAVLTSVRDGKLVIEQKGYPWRAGSADVTVEVQVPTLTRLTVKGAAVAEVSGLHGGRTVMVLTGSSRLTVRGAVDDLVTQFEGSSRADLTQLLANRSEMSVSGGARALLPARTPLTASRDGVGSRTSTERSGYRTESSVGSSRILR